jgi:hypothetical protein
MSSIIETTAHQTQLITVTVSKAIGKSRPSGSSESISLSTSTVHHKEIDFALCKACKTKERLLGEKNVCIKTELVGDKSGPRDCCRRERRGGA